MAQRGTAAETTIDRKTINKLTEEQMARFREHTPTSAQYFDRARKVMPGGVPSSFQLNDPWPVYIDRGKGALVWDVDGSEYVDFHNGFGVMCVGHANPVIGEAVKARHDEGTHFAAPTNGSIVSAENLVERFGLPMWRFSNSGTESTMSAIHLARGATDRDLIIKVEGSYDGHHDAVMVSCYPDLDELGPRESPNAIPFGAGYPKAVVDLTVPVPFNDAEILEGIFRKHEGQIAGMIIEPAMMNINIIPPKEGYLERVRELCDEHGAKLIFDEVKTGATISYGGATQRFGVKPDMICLAKAICGGYPGGAIGMTEELGEVVASDKVHQIGTFNGNPLVMAAAEATLTKVLTPGRLREAGGDQRDAQGPLRRGHPEVRPPGLHAGPRRQGLRDLLPRADLRVPRLPDQGRRRALDARLALPHESRHLHDARRRGGVDSLDRPRAGAHRPLRRRLRGLRLGRQRLLAAAPFRSSAARAASRCPR